MVLDLASIVGNDQEELRRQQQRISHPTARQQGEGVGRFISPPTARQQIPGGRIGPIGLAGSAAPTEQVFAPANQQLAVAPTQQVFAPASQQLALSPDVIPGLGGPSARRVDPNPVAEAFRKPGPLRMMGQLLAATGGKNSVFGRFFAREQESRQAIVAAQKQRLEFAKYETTRASTLVDLLQGGLDVISGHSGTNRATLVAEYGQIFERSFEGFAQVFSSAAEREDIEVILRDFTEFSVPITAMAGGDIDKAFDILTDDVIMDNLRERSDQINRPTAQIKIVNIVASILERMEAVGPQAFTDLERDGAGNIMMTWGQFEGEMNSAIPEGMQLTEGEIGFLFRHPEQLIRLGIAPVDPVDRAFEFRSGVMPDGREAVLVFDPRNGTLVNKIPTGQAAPTINYEFRAGEDPEGNPIIQVLNQSTGELFKSIPNGRKDSEDDPNLHFITTFNDDGAPVLRAFNPKNGQEVGKPTLLGIEAEAAADLTFFEGVDAEGNPVAFGLSRTTGAIVSTTPIGRPPPEGPVNLRFERVTNAAGDEELVGFHPQTGAEVSRVDAGQLPDKALTFKTGANDQGEEIMLAIDGDGNVVQRIPTGRTDTTGRKPPVRIVKTTDVATGKPIIQLISADGAVVRTLPVGEDATPNLKWVTTKDDDGQTILLGLHPTTGAEEARLETGIVTGAGDDDKPNFQFREVTEEGRNWLFTLDPTLSGEAAIVGRVDLGPAEEAGADFGNSVTGRVLTYLTNLAPGFGAGSLGEDERRTFLTSVTQYIQPRDIRDPDTGVVIKTIRNQLPPHVIDALRAQDWSIRDNKLVQGAVEPGAVELGAVELGAVEPGAMAQLREELIQSETSILHNVLSGNLTGPIPAIQRVGGKIPLIGGMFRSDRPVSAKTAFETGVTRLVRSLQTSPKFAMMEREDVIKRLSVAVRVIDNAQNFISEMAGIDQFLDVIGANATDILGLAREMVSTEDVQQAQTIVNDIEMFKALLGPEIIQSLPEYDRFKANNPAGTQFLWNGPDGWGIWSLDPEETP